MFAVASATTVTHAFVWTFTVTSVTVGMGLFMALLIGGGAVWQRWRRQAGGAVGVQGADDGIEFVPSPKATPGELGTVLAGAATYEQVSATVIDLAERGHLQARPLPSTLEGITPGRFSQMVNCASSAKTRFGCLFTQVAIRTTPRIIPRL